MNGVPRSSVADAKCPHTRVGRVAHFRIGVVSVTLKTAVRDVFEEFAALYDSCRTPTPDPGAIVVQVRRKCCFRPVSRLAIGVPALGFDVLTDGEHRFTVYRRDAVLPHIEWALNAAIAATLSGFYQMHAGAVARGGAALLLPAYPQSGKSTLVARLVSRGWDYLSDEFGLIDPTTLAAWPYPKAICIKHGSFPVLEQAGLRLDACKEYDKGYKGRVKLIRAQDIRPHPTPMGAPIRMVLFPRFARRRDPIVTQVSPAQAVFRMLGASFSFARFRGEAVALLASVARRAACHQIESGDLDLTCDVIEKLWRDAGTSAITDAGALLTGPSVAADRGRTILSQGQAPANAAGMRSSHRAPVDMAGKHDPSGPLSRIERELMESSSARRGGTVHQVAAAETPR